MSGPTHDPSLYTARDTVEVRRALISVSDKSDLIELATALAESGVEIVSTGSTAATVRAAGIEVTDVAAVTGFPESLDGRVKTLHPAVHGGLLADLRLKSHREQLEQLGIAPFELVVVNLYPFVETVASGARGNDVVEQIDIGGPAMVRASAKNFANVAIVVSPSSYPEIIEAVRGGGTTLRQRTVLAAAAFSHTAEYDSAVSAWFREELGGEASSIAAPGDEAATSAASAASAAIGGEPSGEPSSEDWPRRLAFGGELAHTLRYGENSHQSAALYLSPDGHGIAQALQLGGKEMSYNNYVDADAALRSAFDFSDPAVAIIKHANPCGIAVASDIAIAHTKAHECDPQSAYGGVVAANRTVTLAMAQTLKSIFTEVLVAPGFDPDALELLRTKKDLRILQLPADYVRSSREVRQLSGGYLVQDADSFAGFTSAKWQLVAGSAADDATRADLEFAWKACRAVKSNAILLAQDGASVGVGMGQVNRVDSCRLAVSRAGARASGSVAASDAYFPFPDGLEILLQAGVRAVVQPGGSIRDPLAIEAATAAGVTMYFTGERHFFH
jgi:phosphoribosylaminoimidazolecarboxamide formyltransferase/IMP cyclohydrolase